MKKTILSLSLFLSAIFAFAQDGKNFIDQPYVEVNGKAEREVTPDRIYLTITISERDSKGKQSLNEQEKDMKSALSGLGIDVAKDLTVKDLESNFMSFWYKKDEIATSKDYRLLVRSAALAGKSIQELKKINVANVQLEKVDYSEMERLRRELKMNAMRNAQSKAADLVGALGQTVGRLLWVMEHEQPIYRPYAAVSSRAKSISFAAEADMAQ
ncbi:MAG: SIMPL domain-containing protein, partial [Prevotellaceae bacterium]|nr:SIMPL domain-containing protein [Prevotellaceae bacterium]